MRSHIELGRYCRGAGVLAAMVATSVIAENSTVLESFETSIASVRKGTWAQTSARVPDGVALTQYTQGEAGDPYVTEGSKSLRVDLTLDDGWAQDFTLTLSPENSATLREAARSPDVARFILRYDIVFVYTPGSGIFYMNHEAYFGDLIDELNVRLGKNTMSIALDLLTGLSTEGQIVIPFANTFISPPEQPFVGPVTVYVDNFRLVDTYIPGAAPLTYLLQSFEEDAHPTGDVEHFTEWGGLPRTTFSRYAATNTHDVRVSDGNHALQVDFSGAGRWNTDFRLPLNNTKLADLLDLEQAAQNRLSVEQLSRYTLRFDILFPDLASDWGGTWMKASVATPVQAFPSSKGRMAGSTGRRGTVSLTLDQVLWGEAAQGAPALILSHAGAWGASGTTLFYDNFRLIDTGNLSLPSDPPTITSVHYDASLRQINLTWTGTPGKTYDVEYADTAGSWNLVLLSDVACPQGVAAVSANVPNAQMGFFRIREKN